MTTAVNIIVILIFVLFSERSLIATTLELKANKEHHSKELDATTPTTHNINCEHCGISNRLKIVGGRNAHVHDFPWMVSVKYWDVHVCGGSVINSRYVITAAHCIKGRRTEMLSVIVSRLDVLDFQEVSVKVAEGIPHAQFDPDTYDYDVGLLRLVRSVRFRHLRMHPICLNVDDDLQKFDFKDATVIGWGTAKPGKSSQHFPRLHKVTLPVVTNDVCRNASGLKTHVITSRMLCAGFTSGGSDACQGDSGGPLMMLQKGRWYQIGIVSWGVGCGKPQYYGVYARISYFTDWIMSNMLECSC